jgi:hypothetical protein
VEKFALASELVKIKRDNGLHICAGSERKERHTEKELHSALKKVGFPWKSQKLKTLSKMLKSQVET